ncbi:MAG: class I SAM-dependent methyltransferase [Pseudomonadota bacterium]
MPVFNAQSVSDDRLAALAAWWDTPDGAYLWGEEAAWCEARINQCFGYHAALLGLNGTRLEGLGGLRVPHRFSLGPRRGAVLARFDALPLAAESVDLVMLHHVLEVALDPHQVLREVDRVLVPEGHLLLLTFNPWGPWGWRNRFHANGMPPWHGQRLGRGRLHDWLGLLGYDVREEGWAGHGCLTGRGGEGPAMFGRLAERFWPSLGMTHGMLARKRVSLVAPIRHRWSLMPVLGVRNQTPVQNRIERK